MAEYPDNKIMAPYTVVRALLYAFPNSVIAESTGTFLANFEHTHHPWGLYLPYYKTELDVDCAVLEWLSKAACEMNPLTHEKNADYVPGALESINRFLDTDFDDETIGLIWAKLGQAINHELTVRFVESGYNPDVLTETPITGLGILYEE